LVLGRHARKGRRHTNGCAVRLEDEQPLGAELPIGIEHVFNLRASVAAHLLQRRPVCCFGEVPIDELFYLARQIQERLPSCGSYRYSLQPQGRSGFVILRWSKHDSEQVNESTL